MTTKTLALVTCCYDLVKRGSAGHRTVDWVLANADFVLGQDRELVIFADPELEDELSRRRSDRRTKIVPVPFEELLRADRFAAADRGEFQHNARKTKVAPIYVQLMWSKYAMLERALEITSASHIGWIDLGITHVAKLPPSAVDVFADPSDRPHVHVLRCYAKREVDHPDYWRAVWGHLAGGLVVGARDRMRELISNFWAAVDRAISMGLAPLDEGLLSYVIGQRPDVFAYSYGDYEDILRNHDEPRGGEAHRQWIVEDARSRGLPDEMTLSAAVPLERNVMIDEASKLDNSPSVAEQAAAAAAAPAAAAPAVAASAVAAPAAPEMIVRRRNDHGPLLGLVMIVKNESKRIVEVLASYRPYIDTWTILDTGSTDGSQDLIRRELVDVPGTLHEEPFVDFATSRNRALALHGQDTVFSIMPNGDVLSGGGDLRAFLEAHRLDHAGSYRVRISPGHYYHPLVMRTGAGWHYKWRTHECAVGPIAGPQIPGVTVVRDRGNRTDAEWRQRWERDLGLLNQDRVEDPADPRPYFYLGQTHECLGQHAQALAFFERRAEMGGYFDEVFEAKFRVGKMKAKIGRPWPEIQQAYLEAYAHDPRRAEPLYEISEHWYGKEIHAVSRIFAVVAAETPKPPTDLFLDEDVYTWKAADRASISSFYAGHKKEARYWADIALSWSPDDERLRSNRAFSVQSAAELFGATARPIAFAPDPGWSASNPSIYADGESVRCIVRTVNYRIVNGRYATPPEDVVHEEGPWKGWQVIRTRNFILDLDADLKSTRTVEMVDETGGARTDYPVHGFEDARLFAWRGAWWATATVCDFTDDGRREIALLEINERGAVIAAEPLRGPWSEHAQKNWMPFVEGDAAKFVYATQPTTIFELTHIDGSGHAIEPPAGNSFGHGRLRGGSQGVRVDGGWIFAVHDVAFPGGGERIYLHRFVFLDDQRHLVSMTDPFYFERLGIEFCAGLAQVGDKLVASYAVNDGSARLGVFDPTAVRRALRRDFVI